MKALQFQKEILLKKNNFGNYYESKERRIVMKSFTSIEQSKKLAKILPIESADMCYRIVAYNPNDTHVYQPYCFSGTLESDIPCWSLAALLDIFPKGKYKDIDLCCGGYEGDKYVSEWFCSYEEQNSFIIEVCHADNPTDACVEMIVKLKEKGIL